MRLRTHLMEEMTWTEVSEVAHANLPVVLPVGSTEQHGPHLPLGTDTILPVGVALQVAQRLPLVVSPPVRFGARSRPLSGGGETFPGNLSLRLTTLIAIVSEILGGLARSGFSRVLVQNWHYENAGMLWEACNLAHDSYPHLKMVVLERAMPDFSDEELAELFPNGFPGWNFEHASIMETSMMMVIRPDLVIRNQIVDDEAERHPSWDVVPAPSEFIPKTGVLWHATEANEELGRRFLHAVSRRLEEAIRTEFDL